MTTSSSEPLAQRCCYSEAGVFCHQGFLYRWRRPDREPDRADGVIAEPERLEGMALQCPKCEGKGLLLTSKGRELLAFLEVFGRPFLRDLVDEFHEEREQH
jgi:hypothetical protein